MKKILISIVFINTLTLSCFATELEDCSVYSKFNPKYLMCKAGNVTKNTINYQNEQWSDKKDKEKTKD